MISTVGPISHRNDTVSESGKGINDPIASPKETHGTKGLPPVGLSG